jgi:hypothetical protein
MGAPVGNWGTRSIVEAAPTPTGPRCGPGPWAQSLSSMSVAVVHLLAPPRGRYEPLRRLLPLPRPASQHGDQQQTASQLRFFCSRSGPRPSTWPLNMGTSSSANTASAMSRFWSWQVLLLTSNRAPGNDRSQARAGGLAPHQRKAGVARAEQVAEHPKAKQAGQGVGQDDVQQAPACADGAQAGAHKAQGKQPIGHVRGCIDQAVGTGLRRSRSSQTLRAMRSSGGWACTRWQVPAWVCSQMPRAVTVAASSAASVRWCRPSPLMIRTHEAASSMPGG